MKKAFITGVTGQDGSYLAELLLEKGYHVYGLQRRSSTANTVRIDHLYDNPKYPNFVTIYGDLADSSNLSRILAKIQPDEIYNLGAQSHVRVGFDIPEYTANVTGLGPLRILDAIRDLKIPARYYQASSSEMFGKVLETPQNEKTPFNPQSPYGLSKVFAFYITRIYRSSYKMFAANGILFNHESERRGITFVTRKITIELSRVKLGLQKTLKLGNLDAKRDWGYSKDYVEAIWKILQHDKPDDFVIATGENHTVREFVEEVGKHLGMQIVWEGKHIKEKGIDRKTGKVVIEIDPVYFRPLEVDVLIGDSTKAQKTLGWRPKVTFQKLAQLMIAHDYDMVKKEAASGKRFEVHNPPSNNG
ncbi:MAG: GDP-mannose 4,6-dehydratase [Candidatus Ryanbacteria bacterium RIFCSPHIGHO2_02_FULL_45_43]|uniref:GDP-mannose 4,6-dehydratase n=1 Tax=Candidatus Ryanbacteria bacterium RIFCSPHIGHO2_01_45_13 TaxID=1802112 RepID=A0A1G2FY62_9BACT|nr:MAG: GDP-mannose 4,6-dehydratase [Candidatus Ryanbacteria bacterium RIFCSPHIGHO2_01_FULL_44_130]OGZ42672.1 MAG: GDP-mannose 4,6-dehydratase [Candidatus Ryanbacteria bacterium RIFCSPHIGHO2_01_45_13]OGZ48839.1 MAG: GDP-mannose 4,6-dehydratase [Candidatus Ryanbacteria bacterium RIFCSPHIGHO2_02_FULL_45_43]OGZ50871.1 MAG: GDP-mannose 4,6-dehydratase [Candidatus Ryanbacteria bacterium RIFCSPHIGHO2_12_FULL_44_20]OGZ52082.1 MAG: GDP-mannose 4,6-dehydratase [Candidatus Ryanbacteria bacterium RIFCSPLO